MPDVFVTLLVDDHQRPVLRAVSRDEPTEQLVAAMSATAVRFDLGDVANVACAVMRACRGCGCTEDEACEGGCSWVDPDLCSSCVGNHIIRAR